MAYRISGSGPPLLKIVGFSATMDVEEPAFIDALARAHQVVSLDNRGMGRTNAGSRPFTIEQFAQDAVGLMDALGLSRAHVMGTSMGGFIAQELALRHPGRVDCLVLMSTSCGGLPSIPIEEEIFDAMCDVSGTEDERLERMAGLLFECKWLEDRMDEAKAKLAPTGEPPPADSLAAQRAAMEKWEGSCERLPLIDSPALAITGTDDLVIPPENSRILASLIPDCRLVEVEGGGHGLTYQFPEECASLVLDFLSGDETVSGVSPPPPDSP